LDPRKTTSHASPIAQAGNMYGIIAMEEISLRSGRSVRTTTHASRVPMMSVKVDVEIAMTSVFTNGV
jgi:hypothetical protein